MTAANVGLRPRVLVASAFATALCACGVDILPQRTIVGVIESTDELGGAGCPLLLTSADGSRWEVNLPAPYTTSFDPDGRTRIWGPEGSVGRTGDSILVTVSDAEPAQSACQWGTAVAATDIGR